MRTGILAGPWVVVSDEMVHGVARAVNPVTRDTFGCVTRATHEPAPWLLLTYRLPAEPSRHRVAVWRELRKVGAISLQQATWALPSRREFLEAVRRALALVERAGGEAFLFDASASDETTEARLEDLFREAREQEWAEFLAECGKFEQEIDKEIRTAKLTPAELDEEEQSLDRLRRWFREIRARDVFAAPSQEAAERRLKECSEALEGFAERVYQAGAAP